MENRALFENTGNVVIEHSWEGTDNDDVLHGNDEANWITGGLGMDELYGEEGDDFYEGGKGDDKITDPYGNSTILYNVGDGCDRIGLREGKNVLRFGEGIAAENITWKCVDYRTGGPTSEATALLKRIEVYIGDQKILEIDEMSDCQNGVEQFTVDVEFANGEKLAHKEVLALAGVYKDTEGSDRLDYSTEEKDLTLMGLGGDDFYHGGRGDDVIRDGIGSSTIQYNLGDGYDVIQLLDPRIWPYEYWYKDKDAKHVIQMGEGIDQEALKFTETAKGDVNVYLGGERILSLVRMKSEELDISMTFADGSTLAAAKIIERLEGLYKGTDQDDVMDYGDSLIPVDLNGGEKGSDILIGGSGEDRLEARYGNDTLKGGAGNDYLKGGGGDNTLEGGLGNDIYEIEDGENAVIHYNLGDGYDTLQWSGDNANKVTVQFGEDIKLADLHFKYVSKYDTAVCLGDEKIINLNGIMNEKRDIVFAFSNGEQMTKDEMLSATQGLLTGTDSSDILKGDDDANELKGEDNNDMLYGNGGDDALYGGKGNDFYKGGKGNDEIIDSEGNSMIWYERGDGLDTVHSLKNTIRFGEGIDPSQIRFGRMFEDHYMSASYEGLRIYLDDKEILYFPRMITSNGTIEFKFANGTLWDSDYVMECVMKSCIVEGTDGADIFEFWNWRLPLNISGYKGDDVIYGSYVSDKIFGGYGNDEIDGYYGNDEIAGSSGEDILHGGWGNDVLNGGWDNDEVYGDSGDDKLYGSKGNDTLYGGEGDDYMRGNGDDDLLYGNEGDDVLYGCWGRDEMHGGDGNDVLYGGQSSDQLYGGEGNDILNGGSSTDYLEGDLGNDTYTISQYTGVDYINDDGGEDTIIFGKGYEAQKSIVTEDAGDLVISFENMDDKVIVQSYFSWEPCKIETVQFGDGTVWDQKTLESKVQTVQMVQTMAGFVFATGAETVVAEEERNTVALDLAAASV